MSCLIGLEFSEERLGHLKRAFSHALPEVVIHLRLVVLERNVADDAEADEGNAGLVACVCDGATLHVHCHSVGEVVKDGLHLLASVNKPVASDD